MEVYEEEWNSTIEEYFYNLREECVIHSKLNTEAGYIFKKSKTRWGLPSVLLPVIMAPFSLMVGWASNDSCDKITASDYINSIGYLIVGIVSGVYEYFNFGEKTSKHFSVSLLYDMIISDINLEMTKGLKFRTQADVFMVRITMAMASANNEEPVIPQKILKKYSEHKSQIKKKRAQITRDISKISKSLSNTPEKNPVLMNHMTIIKEDFDESKSNDTVDKSINYVRNVNDDINICVEE